MMMTTTTSKTHCVLVAAAATPKLASPVARRTNLRTTQQVGQRSTKCSPVVARAEGERSMDRDFSRLGGVMGGSLSYQPGQYPDPELIAQTLEDFPDAAIASIEQGMCLYKEGGYTFLDVRSKPEYDDDGKVPNAVNIPLINTTKRWDLETGNPVYNQTANADFKAQIAKQFPEKDAKILVVCSTGTNRAIQVLQILDGEGYTNIVGLKGGFNKWNETWTTKLARRGANVKYSTVYTADGDALGVHTTGAGFSRMDYADFNIGSIDMTEWVNWADEVSANA